MSIKNIMVAYNGKQSSEAALDYAAAMANLHGAHVTAVLAHAAQETYAAQSRWIPIEARRIIAQANSDAIDAITSAFNEQQNRLAMGERLSLQTIGGRVDAVIAQCARSYDLLIIGEAGEPDLDEHVILHPDQIALRSGRPLLIVPKTHDLNVRHNHAVIAWDGRRAAARALADAMQLLEEDGKVTVLTVGDLELARPIDEVVTHLNRHGVDTDHVHRPANHGVATAIVDFTREHDPGLLVMGAYEHSKFRAELLGGVTTTVLKGLPIPVLMSH